MKSAFFATIFVIVGGVAILFAFPAEDKRAAIEFREARAELGLPPQIEDDLAVAPEPVDQYSTVHVKPKIRATTSRHRHVARHQLAKTATERSHRPHGAAERRKSDRAPGGRAKRNQQRNRIRLALSDFERACRCEL
jgi:hypothetical protein